MQLSWKDPVRAKRVTIGTAQFARWPIYAYTLVPNRAHPRWWLWRLRHALGLPVRWHDRIVLPGVFDQDLLP